jgi:hypothetical protein
VSRPADWDVDDGFDLVKPPKNTWGGEDYQGYNSAWRDPTTGQTFEVQLHTPDSFAAKQATHPLYEQQRLLPEGSPQWRELRERQREIFRSVPQPPGAADIRPPSGGGRS